MNDLSRDLPEFRDPRWSSEFGFFRCDVTCTVCPSEGHFPGSRAAGELREGWCLAVSPFRPGRGCEKNVPIVLLFVYRPLSRLSSTLSCLYEMMQVIGIAVVSRAGLYGPFFYPPCTGAQIILGYETRMFTQTGPCPFDLVRKARDKNALFAWYPFLPCHLESTFLEQSHQLFIPRYGELYPSIYFLPCC